MARDIEWLKKHITKILGGKVKYKDKNAIDDRYIIGLNNAYVAVLEMLESLEVEILSQDWIEQNYFDVDNWDESHFISDGEKSIDGTPQIKVIALQDLEKVIVPAIYKMEKVQIPKFVADFIEENKSYVMHFLLKQ